MTPTSILAKEIQPDIKSFILANVDVAKSLNESSPGDGAEAIAQAIAYGICKAFASNAFQLMFGAGVCFAPPPVPPSPVTPGNPMLGTIMFNALKSQTFEL